MPTIAEGLTADSPFSYRCRRCSLCCRDKLIQVNPYEIARLSRALGISTTVFIRYHLEPDRPYLRRCEDGACIFLGPEGCTVHANRPLVCRVYPLGRHVLSGADETLTRYSVVVGQNGSKGVVGADATIADYLAEQGVAPFAAAAGAYLDTLQALFDAWRAEPGPDSTVLNDAPAESGERIEDSEDIPELLDLDRAVEAHCRRHQFAEPSGLDERMALHLQLIRDWLGAHNAQAAERQA